MEKLGQEKTGNGQPDQAERLCKAAHSITSALRSAFHSLIGPFLYAAARPSTDMHVRQQL